MLAILVIIQSILFFPSDKILFPSSLLARPPSKSMYWLSIGPTVSKVVENQKEKVLAVPEVNTLLYSPVY